MSATAYEDLLRDVYEHGTHKSDRTGTGTISVFGRQIRYDLAESFPLITSKKVGVRLVIEELLWFLTGSSNIKPLLEKNVHIWSEWPFEGYLNRTSQPIPEHNSDKWKEQLKEFERRVLEDDEFAVTYGDLGPVYGAQWRRWEGANGVRIDQIDDVIKRIKADPDSRRLIVSAWNVPEVPKMALSPCHALFQFYVADGKLSCQLYQRSCDMFLGVPFNIASYAFLTHMVAQQCNLKVGEFVWTGGDVHVYDNHTKQVKEQLSRESRPLPQLMLRRKPDSIFDYTVDDFQLIGYDPHPAIKGDVAV